MASILDNLRTYAGKWMVVQTTKIAAEDVAMIKAAHVVESEYGLSVCMLMHSGGMKFIPLSRDSSLDEGDTVDITSIEFLTLAKAGESDILRADGKVYVQ